MAKVEVTFQSFASIDIPDEYLKMDIYKGEYFKYFINDEVRRKALREIAEKLNISIDDIMFVTDVQTDADIYEAD
jgi:phosphoserine phosphatase